MWILILMLLPLSALAYVGWHVWCLLPLGWLWKVAVLALMTGAFLMLFAGLSRTTDRLPMPLAVAVYEVGTTSLIVLLYLFMTFLLLDIGRLLRLLPRTLFYDNWWTVGGIAVAMAALLLYGSLHYRHKYREELQLTTGKPLAKPLKLVMVSDLFGQHWNWCLLIFSPLPLLAWLCCRRRGWYGRLALLYGGILLLLAVASPLITAQLIAAHRLTAAAIAVRCFSCAWAKNRKTK